MIDTAEKLANTLRNFSPTIDDDDVKVIFNSLSGYKICDVKMLIDGELYDDTIKYVKKEFRYQFKVAFIELGYKSDFHPQDCPYQCVLIRITNGEVITPEQIIRRFRNDA
jgi:hypothetical protein